MIILKIVLKNINKDWVKIRLKDGTEGYAAAQFIGDLNAKIEKPVVKEEEKGKEMKVLGTTINIRKGPGTNDEIIARCRMMQSSIYSYRKNARPIPNWFHKKNKNKQENISNIRVEDFIES